MEDELPDASTDELVEHCVAAKVRRQTFGGHCPLQWWFGSQCAREVQEQGLGENRSSFERRLPKQPCFVPSLGRPCVWPSMRDHVY